MKSAELKKIGESIMIVQTRSETGVQRFTRLQARSAGLDHNERET